MEKTAEEILKSKLNPSVMVINNPDYTFNKVIEAMDNWASLKLAEITKERDELKKENEETDILCKKILDGKGTIYVRELKSNALRLAEALEGYEQWEAALIMEDKLWWPNRAQDVLRGAIYDGMLELQEKRNTALKAFRKGVME